MTRYRLDSSVHRYGEHAELLLGGSPTRLFRLSGAGARALDAMTAVDDRPAPRSAGDPPGGDGDDAVRSQRPVETGGAAEGLARRLVLAGVLHPVPEHGDAARGADEVTIVVPVRDRACELATLLHSISEMTVPVARVLVVDDGSDESDSIRAVAAGAGVEIVRRERSGGPAVARNEGLGRVTTTFTAFVDSDCVVDPDWLRPLLAQLADPSVAVAAPRVRATHGDAPGWLSAYERHHSPLDLGAEPAEVRPGTRVSYVPAAALVVRTAAIAELGGFDGELRLGEDVDLIWRSIDASQRVRYEPESIVWHRCRSGLAAMLRQRVDYGSSAATLRRRHGRRVAPAVVSEWSVAGWVAMVAGFPVAALAALVTSAFPVRRRLGDLPVPAQLRLVARGQLGAGAQLAAAVRRGWWPPIAAVAPWSRTARRVLVLSVVTGAAGTVWAGVADAVASGCASSLRRSARNATLRVLDDAAYGIGVWKGCLRDRSFAALLPTRPGGAPQSRRSAPAASAGTTGRRGGTGVSGR